MWKRFRKILQALLLLTVLAVIAAGTYLYAHRHDFARQTPPQERDLRLKVVATAEEWYGSKESDGSHRPIIDIYNSHEPLARGYAVTYEDAWCSAFASAVAIQCGLTDIIPTECGCEPHIERFMDLGRWIEDDSYLPLPGDYIFYHWDCDCTGDCTGWSDHIGIVTGTIGNYIIVIEGNFSNRVGYRILPCGDPDIRGFGIPDYAVKSA